ncbi:FRMPD4 [Branchiostoma lanceolatum]|uniref:FRMPD4 protein n=1 Tax=Branchiostoma lanceolatum TaxID=7740 RepID=A0A8K0EYB1_BRALA|nr:FRMPD4 [Branchiostoma lanceolatum]
MDAKWVSVETGEAGRGEDDMTEEKKEKVLQDTNKRLPTGWQAQINSLDRIYYINTKSHTSNWLPPAQSWACCHGLPYGWELAVDKHRQTYYINHVTQTTCRDDPRTATERLTPPPPRRVELHRDQNVGFGFVAGGERPVVVRNVTEGGPSVGKLLPGDQILKINRENVGKAPRDRVVELVRSCPDKIVLTVMQPYRIQARSAGTQSAQSQHNGQPSSPKVRFSQEVLVNGQPPEVGDTSLPYMPNIMKVFLENGQTRSFRYDQSTTVKDVLDALQEKLNFKAMEHFSLVVQRSHKTAANRLSFLQPDESLSQILAQPGSQLWKVLFRITHVPRDSYNLLRRDPNAFEYLYMQCCNDVIKERYATELRFETALRLAALHMHEFMVATTNKRKMSIKYIEKECGLDKFLPPSMLQTVKEKELKRLLGHHLKVVQHSLTAPGQKTLSPLQAKLHYLKIMSELRSFGGKYFQATLMHDRRTEVVLLVSPHCGLSHVLNNRGNPLALLADFCHLMRVDLQYESDALQRVEIHIKDVRPIKLLMQRDDAWDFACLLNGYYQMFVNPDASLLSMEQTLPLSGLSAPPYSSIHRVKASHWSYPGDVPSQVSKRQGEQDGSVLQEGEHWVDLTEGPTPCAEHVQDKTQTVSTTSTASEKPAEKAGEKQLPAGIKWTEAPEKMPSVKNGSRATLDSMNHLDGSESVESSESSFTSDTDSLAAGDSMYQSFQDDLDISVGSVAIRRELERLESSEDISRPMDKGHREALFVLGKKDYAEIRFGSSPRDQSPRRDPDIIRADSLDGLEVGSSKGWAGGASPSTVCNTLDRSRNIGFLYDGSSQNQSSSQPVLNNAENSPVHRPGNDTSKDNSAEPTDPPTHSREAEEIIDLRILPPPLSLEDVAYEEEESVHFTASTPPPQFRDSVKNVAFGAGTGEGSSDIPTGGRGPALGMAGKMSRSLKEETESESSDLDPTLQLENTSGPQEAEEEPAGEESNSDSESDSGNETISSETVDGSGELSAINRYFQQNMASYAVAGTGISRLKPGESRDQPVVEASEMLKAVLEDEEAETTAETNSDDELRQLIEAMTVPPPPAEALRPDTLDSMVVPPPPTDPNIDSSLHRDSKPPPVHGPSPNPRLKAKRLLPLKTTPTKEKKEVKNAERDKDPHGSDKEEKQWVTLKARQFDGQQLKLSLEEKAKVEKRDEVLQQGVQHQEQGKEKKQEKEKHPVAKERETIQARPVKNKAKKDQKQVDSNEGVKEETQSREDLAPVSVEDSTKEKNTCAIENSTQPIVVTVSEAKKDNDEDKSAPDESPTQSVESVQTVHSDRKEKLDEDKRRVEESKDQPKASQPVPLPMLFTARPRQLTGNVSRPLPVLPMVRSMTFGSVEDDDNSFPLPERLVVSAGNSPIKKPTNEMKSPSFRSSLPLGRSALRPIKPTPKEGPPVASAVPVPSTLPKKESTLTTERGTKEPPSTDAAVKVERETEVDQPTSSVVPTEVTDTFTVPKIPSPTSFAEEDTKENDTQEQNNVSDDSPVVTSTPQKAPTAPRPCKPLSVPAITSTPPVEDPEPHRGKTDNTVDDKQTRVSNVANEEAPVTTETSNSTATELPDLEKNVDSKVVSRQPKEDSSDAHEVVDQPEVMTLPLTELKIVEEGHSDNEDSEAEKVSSVEEKRPNSKSSGPAEEKCQPEENNEKNRSEVPTETQDLDKSETAEKGNSESTDPNVASVRQLRARWENRFSASFDASPTKDEQENDVPVRPKSQIVTSFLKEFEETLQPKCFAPSDKVVLRSGLAAQSQPVFIRQLSHPIPKRAMYYPNPNASTDTLKRCSHPSSVSAVYNTSPSPEGQTLTLDRRITKIHGSSMLSTQNELRSQSLAAATGTLRLPKPPKPPRSVSLGATKDSSNSDPSHPPPPKPKPKPKPKPPVRHTPIMRESSSSNEALDTPDSSNSTNAAQNEKTSANNAPAATPSYIVTARAAVNFACTYAVADSMLCETQRNMQNVGNAAMRAGQPSVNDQKQAVLNAQREFSNATRQLVGIAVSVDGLKDLPSTFTACTNHLKELCEVAQTLMQSLGRTDQARNLGQRLCDVISAFRDTVKAMEAAVGKPAGDTSRTLLSRQTTTLAAVMSALQRSLRSLQAR